MSDEAPVTPDTPEASAPTGTPDINWEQRYNDLRPKFDQTAQEAAALRAEQERLNDEEYFKQLMAQRGYEVEEPDPGYQDPTAAELERLRAQVTELAGWKDNLTQEQLQQQQLQQINASVDEQFRATAPDLDPATREWVETKALSMAPRDDGMPDIQGAYQAFTDWELERQKQWRTQKKRAPHVAAGGAEGVTAPNLDDPDQMLQWQMNRLQDLNA
jgi:hypothetical protein